MLFPGWWEIVSNVISGLVSLPVFNILWDIDLQPKSCCCFPFESVQVSPGITGDVGLLGNLFDILFGPSFTSYPSEYDIQVEQPILNYKTGTV